jgi:hypothetical protein
MPTTTLLFVHGTGVRRASLDATMAVIRREAKDALPDLEVAECFWGETYGARLHHRGDSIPNYALARGGDPAEDAQNVAMARWAALIEDPFLELRLLSAMEAPAGALPPNALSAGEQLFKAFLAAAAATRAQPPVVGGAGLPSPEWLGALQATLAALRTDRPFADLVHALRKRDTESEETVARAIVASVMVCGADASLPALDGAARERLVSHFLRTIGIPGRAGVIGLLAKPFLGLATFWGKRKRGRLSDTVLEPSGDILVYQARGAEARKFLQATIAGCPGDVILMAHSLGGIMSVDLLVLEKLPQVKALVTLGSQAPYMYETGALTSLTPTQPLPSHFPPWLNLFDHADFLSYLAKPVFGERAKDVEVASHQPFPQSHSAYFANEHTWLQVRAFVDGGK